MERTQNHNKLGRQKGDLAEILRKSWYHLRLSVRDSARVPTWDAIVLTAASPEQAQLYEWQLKRAKRMGRIADSTITLAVPDPQGVRIGSGTATLFSLLALAQHLDRIDPKVSAKNGFSQSPAQYEGDSNEERLTSMADMRILLLHAGGDSKRVPWANPMGKVFLPLPYLAADDPDGPVPLLFDHILAVSASAIQAFKDKGGLFIMTGDVLPCFNTSTMVLPDDTSCIITVPITLDVASNHGVVVVSTTGALDGTLDHTCSRELKPVSNLLQKPGLKELMDNQAIRDDGRALLDTGIISVRGKAWVDLLMLASSSEAMVSELLRSRTEMSLYEDLVAAWVPEKHEWLKSRPLGRELINGLGSQQLLSYCAYDLSFLHFGTSSEVLDHLGGANSRFVGRRHLCSIPATMACDIAASAIILSSKIAPGVSIGEDSLIYDSSLPGCVQIGSQSIIVGVNIQGVNKNESTKNPVRFIIPDRHCLWEVPLVEPMGRILVYCGLHDNPKRSLEKDGTFCGQPWKKVLHDYGIQEKELWNTSDTQEKCLWNAKIFPILPPYEMINLAMWLMGLRVHKNEDMLFLWRNSNRISLEDMHRSIDFRQLCLESSNHQADLAAGIAKACISYGLLGRNLSQLCGEVLQSEKSGINVCKDFLALCPNVHAQSSRVLPRSRAYQAEVDILRACGEEKLACTMENKVWSAVADETASAIKYGIEDHLLDSLKSMPPSIYEENHINNRLSRQLCPIKARVELPARVDFVGGWSDTPPWSLERSGCVLNMAIALEGFLPLGAEIETTQTTGVMIRDDAGNQLYIKDLTSITTPFNEEDPFRLVKSSLLVTGFTRDENLVLTGLVIRTWANVPRGSGLGTSSILAAAVVKGLLHIMNGDESNENVARLVLILEQIMGTGGGWQDQIGGLYPGIKCTASFPGKPLQLNVIPVTAAPKLVLELEERLLVVFTGQVRLAHQVLQKVVTRYLQRDNLLISSIKRLSELAKLGQEALMNGDIDELGEIMLEAWRLHQELDPYCSNKSVDRLFRFADPFCCGYKLVGAGGGGFALLLAKDRDNAKELRHSLEASDFDVKVYNWNIFLDGLAGMEL